MADKLAYLKNILSQLNKKRSFHYRVYRKIKSISNETNFVERKNDMRSIRHLRKQSERFALLQNDEITDISKLVQNHLQS